MHHAARLTSTPHVANMYGTRGKHNSDKRETSAAQGLYIQAQRLQILKHNYYEEI